jgi:sugar/nucleoside kinase (ribokinase family)
VTDDIRAAPGPPVDLLVVGGLTIDRFDDTDVVGGAARWSTEGALAAGLSVALRTVAGPEPIVDAAVSLLGERAQVLRQRAATSIVFEHHGEHDARRLRLRATTNPIDIPEPDRLPTARAVLFAPVADEVSADAVRQVAAPLRAAGLQGWLRSTDADGWVGHRRLADLFQELTEALRGLDLLLASRDDLGVGDVEPALAALRDWAGPGPELVVTAGIDGAWVDDGHGAPRHVPAEVVEDAHTIGAGDAFAAVLTARRGSGRDLHGAALEATSATARFLRDRLRPTI